MLITIDKNDRLITDNSHNGLFCNILGLINSAEEGSLVLYTDGNHDVACIYDNVISGEKTCCFATDNTQFVDEVLSTVSGAISCCGVSNKIFAYLQQCYSILWTSKCGLFVHNGLPILTKINYDIKPMDKRYWRLISEGTPYKATKEDILDCLANRPSSAIYIDNRPVCWALTHKEYSLGMLYTMPDYRHKGFALQVISHLCTKLIEQSVTPYAYIIKGNKESENLSKKYNLNYHSDATWCGFEITKE